MRERHRWRVKQYRLFIKYHHLVGKHEEYIIRRRPIFSQ